MGELGVPLHSRKTFALQILFEIVPLFDHLCFFLSLNSYLLDCELALLLITAALLTASQTLKYHTVFECNHAAAKHGFFLYIVSGDIKAGKQNLLLLPKQKTGPLSLAPKGF